MSKQLLAAELNCYNVDIVAITEHYNISIRICWTGT